MAGVRVIHHWGRGKNGEKSTTGSLSAPLPEKRIQNTAPIPSNSRLKEIDVVGIAASTGGPNAIATVLRRLPANFPLPVLVVQHISPGFAAGLADWLGTQVHMRVELAAHGDPIQPGVILLAPDDYHLQVNERGSVELSKSEPFKTLRPSANNLFDSLARVFGPHCLGIILTGMGDDGANGMDSLHQAGGITVAQDEQTCVVYGMPREAVARNAIDYILSLEQTGALLEQLAEAYQNAAPGKGVV
jgi:two-component system chemotaxis response regulator CheB